MEKKSFYCKNQLLIIAVNKLFMSKLATDTLSSEWIVLIFLSIYLMYHTCFLRWHGIVNIKKTNNIQMVLYIIDWLIIMIKTFGLTSDRYNHLLSICNYKQYLNLYIYETNNKWQNYWTMFTFCLGLDVCLINISIVMLRIKHEFVMNTT